jgi:hypothetical protein
MVRDEYEIERWASPLSFLKEVSTNKDIREVSKKFGAEF